MWSLQDVRSALVSNVNIELYNALQFHMVNHRLLTKNMKNGMTVTSMYNDQGLYINHYSNGVSSSTQYSWIHDQTASHPKDCRVLIYIFLRL